MIWPEWTSLHISGTMPVLVASAKTINGLCCSLNLLKSIIWVPLCGTSLARAVGSESSTLWRAEKTVCRWALVWGIWVQTSSMLRKTVCSSVYCISESTGGVWWRGRGVPTSSASYRCWPCFRWRFSSGAPNRRYFGHPAQLPIDNFGCGWVPVSSCYKTLDRGIDPERMNQGAYQLCAKMTIPLLYIEFRHFNSAAYNTIVATLRHVRSIQNFQTVNIRCVWSFLNKKTENRIFGLWSYFSVLWLSYTLPEGKSPTHFAWRESNALRGQSS